MKGVSHTRSLIFSPVFSRCPLRAYPKRTRSCNAHPKLPYRVLCLVGNVLPLLGSRDIEGYAEPNIFVYYLALLIRLVYHIKASWRNQV